MAFLCPYNIPQAKRFFCLLWEKLIVTPSHSLTNIKWNIMVNVNFQIQMCEATFHRISYCIIASKYTHVTLIDILSIRPTTLGYIWEPLSPYSAQHIDHTYSAILNLLYQSTLTVYTDATPCAGVARWKSKQNNTEEHTHMHKLNNCTDNMELWPLWPYHH